MIMMVDSYLGVGTADDTRAGLACGRGVALPVGPGRASANPGIGVCNQTPLRQPKSDWAGGVTRSRNRARSRSGLVSPARLVIRQASGLSPVEVLLAAASESS